MPKSENVAEASNEDKVERFFVGNSELEKLSAKIKQFNILRVLRIEQSEIRHSNVLWWLLNPQESHGLGDAFVKRFISKLLLDNKDVDLGLSPTKAQLMNYMDLEVRREWQNIDLLLISRENRLVVLIENKIRGKESEGQLLKYQETVQQEFADARIIPVLLTLVGDEPSEMALAVNYVPWSYEALLEVATEVVAQQRKHFPQDVYFFLQHYLDTLRRETMQDKELEQLCKSIYNKHRDAIELIVRYGKASAFGEAAEGFIQEHTDLEQVVSAPHEMWFIPKHWARIMPKEVKGWRTPYPLSLWFVQDSHKVKIFLEIGPIPDAKRRRKLVEAFSQAGFKAGKKSYQPGAKFTRVYAQSHSVQDQDDSTETRKALEELWDQSKGIVKEATAIIKNFTWEEQKGSTTSRPNKRKL